MMTARQVAYVKAMREYLDYNDQFPSIEALAKIVGTSKNAAHEMCARLEERQVIVRNDAGKFKRGPLFPPDTKEEG